MRRTLGRALVLTLVGLLGASTARAAPQDETRAEERFREGERLLEAKDYGRAALALMESEQLDPQLGTLINLALCHEGLGRTATAMREFEVAATWAARRRQVDREQYARQHVADLARRTSVVHVSVPEAAGSYAIAIDGEPVAPAQWAMPLFVDGGSHVVRVTAPAMQTVELPLLVPSEPSDQTLAVPTLVSALRETHVPAAPAAPREEGHDARRPLGLIAGGVGAVALSLAGVLWARDGQPSAEAIATAAAGGIVLGGGAFLFFSAGPASPASRPGAQCATLGVSAVW